MTFSEFAKRLHPIISAGSSHHAFVKTIFENMIQDDDLEILAGRSSQTYKAYFNGNTEITKLAKEIGAYIEPEEFAKFIDDFSDAVAERLCSAFEDCLPGATLHNIGEQLAQLFVQIITEAASLKRKKPTSARSSAEPAEAETAKRGETTDFADEDKKITVIQQQINVVQNGEKNINLTNNGTMNFNF